MSFLSPVLYVARQTFEKIKGVPVLGPVAVRVANQFSLNYIELTKKELNGVSPSFCKAKWLQSTIHLEIGETHSCPHPPRHPIDLEALKFAPHKLHNTDQKIQQRQQMVKGERPSGCSYCWKLEDSEQYSDRFYKSAEVWAKTPAKALISKEKIDAVNPSYLEISFSSDCNLKCAYCDPMISSSIKKEIEIHGPYPTSHHYQNIDLSTSSHPSQSSEGKTYTDYFWDWWDTLKKDLHTLRVTGGEPLLSPELERLMLKLRDEETLPLLNFSVNSNLMTSLSSVERFIKLASEVHEKNKIKSFSLFTSIDTWGKQAEFLRWGLRLERFTENLELCLKLYPTLKLTFLVTYQALSVFSYTQLLEYVIDLRKRYPKAEIKIGPSILRYPAFLSLDILDKKYASHIKGSLDFMKEREMSSSYPMGFSKFEISRFERIYHDFLNAPDVTQEQLKDFGLFIQEYEKRKRVNFTEVFAESGLETNLK